MDAGLVRERVAPDDRLVRLHLIAGEARDHPRGARELARVEAGVEAVLVAPGPQEHHDLLQRAVAGPLADAVDRALDLPRAGEQPGVGVGDGHAQVVVAVDRELDGVQSGHQLVEPREVARSTPAGVV